MTNWGQWFSGYADEDIEFVNEIVVFLQNKLNKCKDDETIKKKRLSIQIESLRFMYNLD
jgi:hypothetical protein